MPIKIFWTTEKIEVLKREWAAGTSAARIGELVGTKEAYVRKKVRDLELKPRWQLHGYSKTREYRAWSSAKRRCTDPRVPTYPCYGGRGIRFHEPWKNDFMAFLREVGFAHPLTPYLDRIDVNGHYEPGNVRWVNSLVNATNRRPTSLNGPIPPNGPKRTLNQL